MQKCLTASGVQTLGRLRSKRWQALAHSQRRDVFPFFFVRNYGLLHRNHRLQMRSFSMIFEKKYTFLKGTSFKVGILGK
jgi:hypothetical protein